MVELSFYDVKSKSKFTTSDFEVREKNGRYFAVCKSPAKGATHECWRILSKKQAEELK